MFIITIAQAIAAIYVVFRCLAALNCMNAKTRWSIRWSYITLGSAAFIGVATSWVKPDALSALVLVGVALHLWFSKRKPRHVA